MTKKSKGSAAETWTYGYDHRGQMVWAEQRATDGGTLLGRVEYSYDAFGGRIKRVQKNGAGAVTSDERYALDGWDTAKGRAVGGENFDAVMDLNGSNAVVARLLFGAGADEVVARVVGAAAVPVPTAGFDRFLAIFNGYCDTAVGDPDPRAFLAKHLPRTESADGDWRLHYTTLLAMNAARAELAGGSQPTGARGFRRHGPTTWLKYVTFRHRPQVPPNWPRSWNRARTAPPRSPPTPRPRRGGRWRCGAGCRSAGGGRTC